MALTELGVKYPCQSEGIYIAPDDDYSTMAPGDILEAWFTADEDIPESRVNELVWEIYRMKEEYPDFVLHYVKVERRKITVQFSTAPPAGISGQAISGNIEALHWAIYVALAALAAILAVLLIPVAIDRGYLLPHKPPTGSAVVIAKDRVEGTALPNVIISTNGLEGTTGPNGEGVLFEDLLVGDHVFTGSPVEGYDPPKTVTAAISEDKQTNVTILYNPEGVTPPTHGWLHVETDPVKGIVFINSQDKGEAPVSEYLPIGDHKVSFGAVEGYITPPPQTITVQGDPEVASTIGYYLTPEPPWYEKYLMYGLASAGIIAGAAIVIPRLIRALRRQE